MNMPLYKHGRRDRNKNETGSSFIEVAIASVALGVIVFIGLDAYVWTQAFMINDLACRDACRAAAGATSTTNTPAAYALAAKNAAQRELDLHIVSGPWIKNPQLVSINWNDMGASNGNPMPPVPQTPNVRVRTSLDVNLPVPITFMQKTVLNSGVLTFHRSYTMPIVTLPPP
jgi:hypothetical protein